MVQRDVRRYLRLGHREAEIQPTQPPTTSALCPHRFVPRDSKDMLMPAFLKRGKWQRKREAGASRPAQDERTNEGSWLEIPWCLLVQHEHVWIDSIPLFPYSPSKLLYSYHLLPYNKNVSFLLFQRSTQALTPQPVPFPSWVKHQCALLPFWN